MKRLVSAALAASIIVSVFAISACENNESEVSSPESSVESSEEISVESSEEGSGEISVDETKVSITSSQLSQLNTFISSYTGVPEFTCTSDSINAGEISEGKTLNLITDNISDSYSALVSKQLLSASGSSYFSFSSVTSAETNGTDSSYAQALSDAVENNSDGVVLFGNIDKDSISSQIEQTQANGIKVYSAGNAGVDSTEHYVDGVVPINYQLIGQLIADWVIVQREGKKVNVLVVNYSDSNLSNTIYSGFAEEFEKYVSSGYCTTINASSIEIGSGLSTKVKSALTEDTNINYVVVLSEELISDTISGVTQSGNASPIVSTGGSPEVFSYVQSGSIEMLVAQSYEWTAYAILDYMLRVMGKLDLPEEQDVPVRVLTSETIDEELEANSSYSIDDYYKICFGSAFVSGYSNLWLFGY